MTEGQASGASQLAAAELSTGPGRAGLVLMSLILGAAVAKPVVANVALPDIGLAFDASQTELNLVAACYSLGLAGSVGDRVAAINQ